jgi:hypothetical protein
LRVTNFQVDLKICTLILLFTLSILLGHSNYYECTTFFTLRRPFLLWYPIPSFFTVTMIPMISACDQKLMAHCHNVSMVIIFPMTNKQLRTIAIGCSICYGSWSLHCHFCQNSLPLQLMNCSTKIFIPCPNQYSCN